MQDSQVRRQSKSAVVTLVCGPRVVTFAEVLDILLAQPLPPDNRQAEWSIVDYTLRVERRIM